MERMISIGRNRNVENPELVGFAGLKLEGATPRKAGALKDLTNKNETYSTPARKGPNVIPLNSTLMKTKHSVEDSAAGSLLKDFFSSKLSQKICLESVHTLPVNKNCYCCSFQRKTDEECWGQSYALSEDTFDALINQPLVFHESSEYSLDLLNTEVPTFQFIVEKSNGDEDEFIPVFPQYESEDALKNLTIEENVSYSIEDPELFDCSILSNWEDESSAVIKTDMSFNDSIF